MKLNFCVKAVLLLMAFLMVGISKAQAQLPTNQSYFLIVNQNSGKAIDLIGGKTTNGSNANQYSYNYDSNNQHWALLPTENKDHFKIISQVSGKALCIAGDSTTTGAQLWTWVYTGNNPAQQWDLVDTGNGWFSIKNVRSGLFLDVAYSSTADNGTVWQWTSNNGGVNQKWRLQPWGDYYFRAEVSGKYVGAVDSPNGSKVVQHAYETQPWYQWRFNPRGDGWYSVQSLYAPGRALCVPAASTTVGQSLHIWDYNVNNIGDQKVRIRPRTDGTFSYSFAHDNLVWDIQYSGQADFVPLTQYSSLDSSAQKFRMERVVAASSSNSIYSVTASSIPTPVGSGAVSFRVMNGTNGTCADNQIYWGILGQDPANGNRWSYLDINGNLQPISSALNDANGHLTKNGVNYANVYSTVAQKQWINMPKITSGRMFLSVGGPCYIKTNDNGFAGPNINNSADPNIDVYFDFTEFTLDNSGYHGNTTRADQFGFPIQHRLTNLSGSYDQTVGEFESETRAGIFSKYQNEVPSEFKSLGTVQAPYRIVAPINGSFAPGQANANYFAGYSNVSTRDILLGIGGAADPATCAALNRHVYTNPQSTWNNVSTYYGAAPANYYAKFWHTHAINGLAYGFAYDDVNGQAAYLEVGAPKGLIIRVGW